MSFGGGPTLGGGLMVSGGGGGAYSPAEYHIPLAPLACPVDPGGGGCSSCQCQADGGTTSGGDGFGFGGIYPAYSSANGSGGRGGSAGGSGWTAASRMDFPLDLGGISCAPSPDPGTSPQPVPGPGSPYSDSVTTTGLGSDCSYQAVGLSITCSETGVTQVTVCFSTIFYHNALTTTHYTTPGGIGTACNAPGDQKRLYGGASATGTGNSSVDLSVPCTVV